MSEWKTISEAPKDGSYFLFCTSDAGKSVFIGKYFENGLGYFSYTDTSDKNYLRWGSLIKCGLTPTHFMPLPNPPEVK